MRLPTFALFAAMAITLATGCSGKSSNDPERIVER